jgi:prophage DNA circulation protein
MPIKLLSKQEINQKQALQRHNEIEEGRKLAKRVDNLREIAVQEEASLASFRSNTLKAINDEIKKATKEHEGILNQVRELRGELETGFSELKKAENVVKLKEEDLVSRENQVEERVKLIKEKEKQINKFLAMKNYA